MFLGSSATEPGLRFAIGPTIITLHRFTVRVKIPTGSLVILEPHNPRTIPTKE